jgi:hypothetical protein
MNEINAWTDAYLEDIPLSRRDDSLTNLLNGLRIAQRVYEMGVDTSL